MKSAWNFLDFMPEQATAWASQVDFINNFITYVAAFCTVAITGAMLFFAWKYRRKSPDHIGEYITHNATLETVWTVVPTLVCVFVAYYGFAVYHDMRTPPVDPVEINVEGYQWGWNYIHANGKKAAKELYVPVGKPVRLILSSRDVNHSFFLPAMRVKEDVLKGTYHYLWFTPTKTGDFPIFCAEYCGREHSGMLGTLKVVSPEQYQDYINDRRKEELSPVQIGEQGYGQRCIACHSVDGSPRIGPSFKGLYGKTEQFEDGGSASVDDNYIRESILDPQKHVVKGYSAVKMTSFAGQLSDEELNGLIAYIKSLK